MTGKTLDELVTELRDGTLELLDAVVELTEENVSEDAAEEYADDNGWVESDGSEEEEENVSVSDARTAVIDAYKAGREATLDGLKEAVEEAKG
jgi:ribosomal protein L7/L12